MPVDETLAAEIEQAVDASAKEAEERHEVERRLTNEEIVENVQSEQDEVQAGQEGAEAGQEQDADPVETLLEAGQGEEGEGADLSGDQEIEGQRQVKPPTISDEAIEAAVVAGVPYSDAKQFASEDQLRRVTSALEEAHRQETVDPEVDQEKTILDGLPDLDPEDYKPEVIEIIDGLKAAVKQQNETIEAFRSAQSEATNAAQAAEAREIVTWFDKQVEGLGADFTDALGSGAVTDLPQGSSQAANRDKIATQMSVMLNGYNASGVQAPSREQVFEDAARVVLRDEFAKVGKQELEKKLETRSGQHIQPAGSTNQTQKLTPMEETARLIDEKYFS
jgi:hypothetical protein